MHAFQLSVMHNLPMNFTIPTFGCALHNLSGEICFELIFQSVNSLELLLGCINL